MVLDKVGLWGGGKRDIENIIPIFKRRIVIFPFRQDRCAYSFIRHMAYIKSLNVIQWGKKNPKTLKHPSLPRKTQTK